MAVGRRPNVDGLDLEKAGVEYSPKGIPVDDNMRTNVGHIYAIGDVNARMMLAHVASYQGRRALNAIDGRADEIRLDVVPAALFTSPECAMAGLTEEQCKERGMAVRVGKSFYRANGKALAEGRSLQTYLQRRDRRDRWRAHHGRRGVAARSAMLRLHHLRHDGSADPRHHLRTPHPLGDSARGRRRSPLTGRPNLRKERRLSHPKP